METKQEASPAWNQGASSEPGSATQVHFEAGAVAQIVYSGEQSERGQQQVVYAADGTSYAAVEPSEHTLVYIHPADGTQAVFADQPQVAYIQQDGTTQQVTVLLPSGQNMNTANLHVLSNVAEAPSAILEPVSQGALSVSSASLPTLASVGDPSTSPLGATDSTVDSEDEEDDEEGDDSDLDDWEPAPLQPFNPQTLWCEECNNANPSVCLKHGPLHPIANRPVLSKARASLPLVLYVDRFQGGVYSKRRIPKRTQFGPVEGPLVRQSELQDGYIHLKVCMLDLAKDGEKKEDLWLDLSDEELCNWLMFVRPAQNHLEQNLVAYQYGPDIFYTTIKNIQPKQELKVWYAASYAEFVNQKIYNVTDEERKVLREQEKNWPCYECNRRFMSSEQLQQHLNMHDDKLDFVSRARGRSRGRGRRRFGTGRRPGRPPKFIRLDTPAESSEDKTKEMLAFAGKGAFADAVEGALNGLKGVELGAQGAALGQMDAQTTLSEMPPGAEPAADAPPPPSGADATSEPTKDDSSLGGQLDPHLTPQDMRRAKRIRNAALQHLFIRKSFRPFRCSRCGKAFRDKDKLDQHFRYHGRDGSCPLTCHTCNKGFLSSAALEEHLHLHAEQRTYSCLFCTDSFDRLDLLKEHVGIHLVDGCFSCPSCKKTFTDFIQVKKHVRSFHSEKVFQCTECEKAFCRPDKLRLHMLRHSDRKDFLCSTCGKQFKRKDKLREHMQRMHNPEREAKKADRIHRSKTLKQKVPTTDFESFMFKCRLCMMGFRRRGMLVNHLSKRHPEMRIDEVPELTLPIIKPNRDYFCQYCDKVYKSASKRKAHILKNHPGAELPPSIRKLRPAGPGEPDPMISTHTQLTGTIATAPVCCPHCAKQYSSKTKMVQHIRKKHPEFAQLANTVQAPLATTVISSTPAVIADGATAEAVVTTDLLTQAMTELSQTLTTDYRTAQGDYQRIQYIPVSQAGGGLGQPQHIQLQVVQVAQASSPHSQHSTVDVSQLHDPHSYSQHSIQVQHVQVAEPAAQVAGQPLSPSSQQAAQELSPAQLTPVTLAQSHALQTSSSQQQGAVQHAYLPGNWNYRGYSSEIQMMALPHAQYVIAEAGTPVTAVNTGQVKTTHYVISEGQTELDSKQAGVGASVTPVQTEQLEQQPATTQYIITTTTNGGGASEVHIAKP
ncbi:PR domain zinc finger protein 10 [Paramormyrops kingsleyae]|uniref:PR domain zinc finger protein 10 n=1 Tax=Paramormyrops kingsleyae TaxID=1676925 RepID=A0A3B3SV64_9TELE|nr:PR domain zinc finger protein 10 [Paramormyrops kingsleyae]XP_023663031.1 PR domain zinc finger protein 10 [Paramormyrops kingsleyae]XP_023663032.1 PR domain zinc finger protein 10 [Paramormyrops kingsleyae]XP_023663033.1 PR domain zinc finger protein 10 [Paramormyrops kingsleyae]XP_023663034.1 PR domain zinc finger protein 10 [Paramormyrops kingsleyae]XP_023663035.1 PR domain zinc finger protein 10 [Paramormyrops kingsleyae]